MKRSAPKKSNPRGKNPSRKSRNPGDGRPLEFERDWQDLEAQASRLQPDWMSLAAQMGINSKGKSELA